jgi:hypothetical protein
MVRRFIFIPVRPNDVECAHRYSAAGAVMFYLLQATALSVSAPIMRPAALFN